MCIVHCKQDGESLLMAASFNEHVDVVCALTEASADVHLQKKVCLSYVPSHTLLLYSCDSLSKYIHRVAGQHFICQHKKGILMWYMYWLRLMHM